MARVYVNNTVERNMASVVGQNISPRVLGGRGAGLLMLPRYLKVTGCTSVLASNFSPIR
jgi:hypothetical protein